MNKITVIHHSADYDGIFCREVAKKFLPADTVFIGWDFKDAPLSRELLGSGDLYILDLPVGQPFGLEFKDGWICENGEQKQPIDRWDSSNITWIDHHKSSIETHPTSIPGYRIDGVAACRLAWQWFTMVDGNAERIGAEIGLPIRPAGILPMIQDFKQRTVNEPLAVRLAGEYDIWDKRDPRAELFQHALRSRDLDSNDWRWMLGTDCAPEMGERVVEKLLERGEAIQYATQRADAGMVSNRSFIIHFEGLTFLTLNTARCNSLTFAAKDIPETQHDGLMGFYFDGKKWNVSLYHAKHRMDLDLSAIATKYGGGGHRGACGFNCKSLPFVL